MKLTCFLVVLSLFSTNISWASTTFTGKYDVTVLVDGAPRQNLRLELKSWFNLNGFLSTRTSAKKTNTDGTAKLDWHNKNIFAPSTGASSLLFVLDGEIFVYSMFKDNVYNKGISVNKERTCFLSIAYPERDQPGKMQVSCSKNL